MLSNARNILIFFSTGLIVLFTACVSETQPLPGVSAVEKKTTDEVAETIDAAIPVPTTTSPQTLEKVVERVNSTFTNLLELAKTKQVLVVAHGNSIRAMVKMLDNLSNTDIVDVNIPTGIPLAYKISENENVKIGYLGDSDKIEQLQKEVELQSKVKDEKG